MGAAVGSTSGGRRRRGSRRRGGSGAGRMSDINVTPFVDVMLVLLIVFMVAAPLLTVGVKVDLPKTSAGPVQDQPPPGAVVGPPVRTIARAGAAAIRRPATVSAAKRIIEPCRLALARHARVCAAKSLCWG